MRRNRWPDVIGMGGRMFRNTHPARQWRCTMGQQDLHLPFKSCLVHLPHPALCNAAMLSLFSKANRFGTITADPAAA